MKRIGLILFLLNSKVIYSQSITFEKVYNIPYYNVSHCARQTFDSGYVFVAQHSPVGDTSSALIRTDPYGDTLWMKTFCEGRVYWVEETNDSGYVTYGIRSAALCNSNGGNFLVRTNSSGDTLWTKIFDAGASSQGRCVQQTKDNGFILCGEENPNVIKTDSAGDTLWTRFIPVEVLFSIKQTFDSGYVVAGWTGIFLDPYYIAKLDTAGNIQWYKTFYDSNFSSFRNVIQMPDSGFIASGDGNRLYRVNAQGDSVWSSMPGQGGYVIDNTSDGGYIVAGTNLGVRLTKWDANNNLQWVKSHYPVPNYFHHTNSIQQTSDGGYVVCGYGDSAGVQKVYLLKTDSLGNVYTGINENEPEKTQGMVYPNPLNDVGYLILVNQNYAALKNSSFTLYDVTGKILREENSIKFPFKIERNDLKSGMYFYKVADEKGLMVSGKIIMQ